MEKCSVHGRRHEAMIDLPGGGSSGRAFDSAPKVMSSSLSLLFPQAKSTWKIRHGLVVVAAAS